ncbi:sensor histidine kinase [Ekhidna sp.]
MGRKHFINQSHIWYPPLLASVLYGIYVISTNFNSPENFSWLALSKAIIQFYFYLYVTQKVDRWLQDRQWKGKSLTLVLNFMIAWILSLIFGMILYVILKQTLIIIDNQNDSIGFYHLFITFLSITVGYVLIFSMFLVTKSQQERLDVELKNVAFEREKLRLKYDVLYNKLEPHFLFNNLNTLHSLIASKDAAAESFVISLSKVMRHSLQSHEKSSVLLSEEVEVFNHYLTMLKERVGEALIYSTEIQSGEEERLVPMTLPHLLENIVKHNEISKSRPMLITIKKSDDGILISNTLNKKGNSISSSKGSLDTLKEMYRIKADKEIRTTISDGEFHIYIPFLKA